LKLAWKTGLKGTNYLWNSPSIMDGIVVMSMRTESLEDPFCLHALRLDDGSVLWRNEAIWIDGTGSVTFHENNLLACGIYGVYSLDPRTGETRWEYPVDKLISECAPAVLDNLVYAGSVNGKIYALEINSGELVWQHEVGNWALFSPSIWNGRVYFGTTRAGDRNETFFALDALSGTLEWKYEFERGHMFHYNCTAAIRDGIVYVSVKKYGLISLDADTGKLLWVYRPPSGPSTAPCISDDTVYVASGDLYAVDMKTGKEIWSNEDCGGLTISTPIIAGDFLYIGGGHHRVIRAFDRRTGEQVWGHETQDIIFSTPAVVQGRLLIGCHDGFLYCFEEE